MNSRLRVSTVLAPWFAMAWLCFPGCQMIDFAPFLTEEGRVRARCQELATTLDDRRQSAEQRVLAIQALAKIESAESAEALKRGLTQAARRHAEQDYSPELHAELIRAMSQRLSPADDKDFAQALFGSRDGASASPSAKDSPHAAVRLQALLAYADHHQRPPLAGDELRFDADSRVRAGFIRAVANGQGVDELAYVREALQDHDLTVRLAAVDALGAFATRQTTAQARQTLLTLADDSGERIRAQAVESLGRLGSLEGVLARRDDNSWRVRAAVARMLAGDASAPSQAALAELIADSIPHVQDQAVAAMGRWPLEIAGPLLLHAMDRCEFEGRKSAAEQLARKWPPAKQFSPDGPRQQRAEQLKRLRQAWTKAYGAEGLMAMAAKPAADLAKKTQARIAPERLRALRAMLEAYTRAADESQQEKLNAALVAWGPDLAEGLHTLTTQEDLAVPERVYRSVLPAVSQEFESLARWADASSPQRVIVAHKLELLANESPLSPLAVARLAALMTRERDATLWRSALSAVANDSSAPARRLAYLAIGHNNGEIRRRACAYLERFPSAEHAKTLLGALEDSDPSVLQAAARAVGYCGPIADVAPLERLLEHGDHTLQVTAATALARLHQPTGLEALERLTHDADPNVRVLTAAALGELADASTAPWLTRLLDDRPSVRRAAQAALPKVTGSANNLPSRR